VIGQHLELDMPRPVEKFLHVDLVVAEGSLRLGSGHADGMQQRRFAVHDPHATATTATRGLDDHGKADITSNTEEVVGLVSERTVGSRNAGHTGGLHRADRRDLVAHQPDGLGARANEGKAALLDTLGEVSVLREETVAGVDSDRVGDLGGADERRHVEVAVARRRRTDAYRFVGEQHVLEIPIGGGVHRNRLDAELAAGAQDAQRDFAAVRDEDLVEHGWPCGPIR
jgi:hypothetical protein